MNTKPSSVDVFIVGAGPTGLTLACDLARRNVDHRIIERSTLYNVASRAKGIQPRSLEVVDDLEAVHYIIDTGVVDLPVRYYTADVGSVDNWQLQATIPADIEEPEQPSLEVYQAMF